MDVLADVLAVTRFSHSYLGYSSFAPPWGFRIEPAKVATFHIVSRGSCWLVTSRDSAPIRLNQGDIALIAHGEGHILADHPDTQIRDYEAVANSQLQNARAMPDSTDLFCGVFHFEQDNLHPLLSLLSPVVHLAADQALNNNKLQILIQLLMQENCESEPGSTAVKQQLMNVLFVYIVRAWLELQPERSAGWLGALRDPSIGKVLALIHESPQQRWTVNKLASAASMSRAAFAKRFNDLVGESPLAYVTRWRMDLAANLLRESNSPIIVVASQVGYDSETAFSKIFRRSRGLPPGQYRAKNATLAHQA
ncbi:Transcriptional regulator, AraC family [hydrothermal vent metagenome]|uniref:Transcriptional regulator, AraC family n=1 Tax=hydrothermal vent metagenome TaxID=652676 RepID=A0A3B0YZD6_9ZZZZ